MNVTHCVITILQLKLTEKKDYLDRDDSGCIELESQPNSLSKQPWQ